MAGELCHRCRYGRREGARYCAVCGCPFVRQRAPVSREPNSDWGTIVAWIFLALLIAVLIRAPEEAKPKGLVYSPVCQLHTGLVYDFPPDYPSDMFVSAQ